VVSDHTGTKLVFPESYEYEIFRKDRLIIRLPKNPGFFFDTNGGWVYQSGNKARIGVTDLVQQSLYDIIYFSPPAPGSVIQQLGELAAIESAKAVFAVASPVAGKVTAVNQKLVAAPELMNQDPYEKGWIAEVELADFERDRKLLLDFAGFFPKFQQKVAEFRRK
jgi:glycine cleavage system H protein